MGKKDRAKKKSTVSRKRHAPLQIPLTFFQIVDGMLQTPPKKKKKRK